MSALITHRSARLRVTTEGKRTLMSFNNARPSINPNEAVAIRMAIEPLTKAPIGGMFMTITTLLTEDE